MMRRTVHYTVTPGEYELSFFDSTGEEHTIQMCTDGNAEITVRLDTLETTDITEIDMYQKIRLTADWTNPETAQEHKAGEIITVPDHMLRLENANGLHGKYSCNLTVPDKPDAKQEPKKPDPAPLPKPSVPPSQSTDTDTTNKE